jgi:hypothetical protein
MRLTLDRPAALTASLNERTITGLVLPYGEDGRTSLGTVRASAGAVTVAPRVLGNVGHDRNAPAAVMLASQETPRGLSMTFQVPPTARGDELLAEVAAGLRTGLSVEVDGPVIRSGQLTAGVITWVGFVTEPAFPSAQVAMTAADTPDDEDDTEDVAEVIDATTDGQTTLVETTAATVEVTVTDPPAPDDEPSTDDTEDDTMPDAPATAATAAPRGLTAAATQRRTGAAFTASTFGGFRGFVEALTAAHRNRDHRLLASLTDITQTAHGVEVQVPDYVGELWSGRSYQRRYVPLVTNKALTSYTVKGWRFTAPPTVAAWSGDKTAVPSNAVTTEAVSVDAERLAGAHDIDRKFRDFGDTEFFDAYYRALTESYAIQSDAACLAFIEDSATQVAPGQVETTGNVAAAAIVDAALAVLDKGAPSFAVVSSQLYRALLLTPRDQLLELLSMSLGLEDGSMAGFSVVGSTTLTPGSAIVGVSNAVTWHELGGGAPIRVEAIDMVEGGVDAGVFGYYAVLLNDAAGLAQVTAAASTINAGADFGMEVGDPDYAIDVMATYADGTIVNLGPDAAVLTSATPAKATIVGNRVHAVAAGTSVITATYQGKTDTATVTVS